MDRAPQHTTFPRKIIQSWPQWGSAHKNREHMARAPPHTFPRQIVQSWPQRGSAQKNREHMARAAPHTTFPRKVAQSWPQWVSAHKNRMHEAKASAHTTFPRKVIQSRPQWGSAWKKRRRSTKAPPKYSPFPALQNSYRPAPLVSRWKEYCNTFNSVFGAAPGPPQGNVSRTGQPPTQ